MTDNKTRPVTPTSDNKTNSMWKVTDYVNEVDRLQKQLEEVKANADYQIEGRELEIEQLKAQIEKLKEENKELKEYKVLAEIWEKETENLARKCDGKTKSVKDFSKYVDELINENNHLLDVINNQDVKIADLEKENKEYESEARECNIRLDEMTKKYVPRLVQAKEIIKEYLRIANCVIADKPEFEKLTKKAKRLINLSEKATSSKE